MRHFGWLSLMMVCLGLSLSTTGCGVKKQVRYTSGPPNVAVSARTLHQVPDSQSAQVTYSNNTRYVQVNEGNQQTGENP